jgi:hypothetical protein
MGQEFVYALAISCLAREGAELIFADWFPLHSLFPQSCSVLEPSPHNAKAVGLFKGPLPALGLRERPRIMFSPLAPLTIHEPCDEVIEPIDQPAR